MYIDETYHRPYSYNVLASDTPYIRDDGTRQIGFNFMHGRQFFRRLKRTFVELGVDYSVWVHTTSWKVTPVMTFIDLAMDGEHPVWGSFRFANYHEYYNWEMSRGYLSGLPFGCVGSQMFHVNRNSRSWPDIWLGARTYMAVTLPHGIVLFQPLLRQELPRVQNVLYEFGIFQEDLDELRSGLVDKWLPGGRSDPAGMLLAGLLNRRTDEAIIYAVAPPDKGTRFVVVGGFNSLALKGKHRHVWDAETGVSLNVEGQTVIEDIYPGDVAVVMVRTADQPQVPRPSGAVVGVSFDKGFDPDFGAGIRPVGMDERKPAPQRAPGRSGKAVRVDGAHSSLGYPVVPSWVEGTLQFDLKPEKVTDKPLRVLALRHHLDVDLELLQQDGAPALRLTAHEIPYSVRITHQQVPATLKGDPRDKTFPLPNPADWQRVMLVWRAGQYELWLNGKLAGKLEGPSAAKMQDDQAMPYGVVVGPEKADGDGAAMVDSLLLYDWPLAKQQIDSARVGLQLAKRPAPDKAVQAWVWGVSRDDYHVAVDLRRRSNWETVSAVRLTLMPAQDGQTVLANGTIPPWMGTGTAVLRFQSENEDDKPVTKLTDEQLARALAGPCVLRIELMRDEQVEQTLTLPLEKGLTTTASSL